MTHARMAASVLVFLLAVSACKSAEQVWQDAEKENSASAYEGFLDKYPDSDRAPEARRRMLDLMTPEDRQQHLNRELIVAARQGNTVQVRELVSQGADAGHEYNYLKYWELVENTGKSQYMTEVLVSGNPIHDALFNGHVETANALLDLGATDQPDSFGKTALAYAVQIGDEALVERLMELGSSPTQEYKYPEMYLSTGLARYRPVVKYGVISVLEFAQEKGRQEIIRLLVEAEAR